jgi:Family of unknown function (DUF5317)
MRFVLVTLILAVLLGYLAGGRLGRLGATRLRWPVLAFAGIALQLLPIEGTGGYAIVLASFALLAAFAVANIRHPGFALILVGLALNALVIAVNRGMPVTRAALVESDQSSTYSYLVHHGGAKHHLATGDDQLLFLGDVIPVPGPIAQAVSIGDLTMFAGISWFVVARMRRPPVASTPVATPHPSA